MKSIMPFDVIGRCYICKANCHTDTHHIFQGSNRQASDKYGLTIQVCRVCHRRIHQTPKPFEYLKSEAQIRAMEKYKLTIEEWRKLFRKDYRE